jgi:hypothetical protein
MLAQVWRAADTNLFPSWRRDRKRACLFTQASRYRCTTWPVSLLFLPLWLFLVVGLCLPI